MKSHMDLKLKKNKKILFYLNSWQWFNKFKQITGEKEML